MPKKPSTKRKIKVCRRYPINQCALYKIGSIKKLCQILKIEKEHLDLILKEPKYRIFTNKETFNPFSGKRKKARQVQEPFGILRRIHERILYLLEPIELPDYAHAAVKKRSYRSNAFAHVNSERMGTFDLKNFYGSTQSHLVYYFFLDELKCAKDVSGVLTKLTTFSDSMPTGSPLSPLLSLHASKPMLNEIASLAHSHNLIFTCYIDDLTLSGKIIPKSLERHIRRIIKFYGYRLSKDKTRIFNDHQAKHVTGIVIHKGKLNAPFSRFVTVRNIESAISGNFPTHGYSELKLLEKRAGLLGETAYIDSNYKKWAEKAQDDLRTAQAESGA